MRKALLFLNCVLWFLIFANQTSANNLPVIISITPAQINYNDIVTIEGNGFTNYGSSPPVSGVFIVNTEYGLAVQEWTDTKIKVRFNYIPKEGSANVIVKIPIEGVTTSSNEFVVNLNASAFAPQITSATPTALKWGQQLTINGNNFSNTLGGSKVLINGLEVDSNVQWSTTSIKVNLTNKQEFFQDNKIKTITVISYSKLGYENMGWTGWLQSSKNVDITILPPCDADTWICGEWKSCESNGHQERTCNQTYDCQYADTPSPTTSQSCTYIPTCTLDNWSCTNWTTCSVSGNQTRTCSKTLNCQDGVFPPATSQTCTFIPTCVSTSWTCGSWSVCASNGTQTRTCNKNSTCEGGTLLPATTQACTYTPACSADTWSCGNWGTCSPQGIQTRSCNRTYDCPSAETESPATSQYCESSYKQNYQTPTENSEISNQSTIIKSTVKLICLVSSTKATQGSGTVISSSGMILTNKHVIEDTYGCLVGFISNYNDNPYFNDRQIADVYKVSSDADVAILKLRNPSNKILSSIDISTGNNNSLKVEEILTIYGYPAVFGKNITITNGGFSGVDGSYLKVMAVIEHGSSGGGAYQKNGTFIGIPTAVIKGSLNSLGYLLSINKINSWLNNSPLAYNDGSSNKYSRVSSILEDINLSTLGNLDLFVQGDDTGQATTENKSQSLTTKDKNFIKKLAGKILLQVEEHGEAWYINPKDNKKYYMKDGAAAYTLMRYFSLGITNQNLDKIPKVADTTEMKNSASACSKYALANQLKGKILLQVEEHGEAWYVEPTKCRAIYLKDGNVAYEIMKFLGLGITNNDLGKITEGGL